MTREEFVVLVAERLHGLDCDVLDCEWSELEEEELGGLPYTRQAEALADVLYPRWAAMEVALRALRGCRCNVGLAQAALEMEP